MLSTGEAAHSLFVGVLVVVVVVVVAVVVVVVLLLLLLLVMPAPHNAMQFMGRLQETQVAQRPDEQGEWAQTPRGAGQLHLLWLTAPPQRKGAPVRALGGAHLVLFEVSAAAMWRLRMQDASLQAVRQLCQAGIVPVLSLGQQVLHASLCLVSGKVFVSCPLVVPPGVPEVDGWAIPPQWISERASAWTGSAYAPCHAEAACSHVCAANMCLQQYSSSAACASAVPICQCRMCVAGVGCCVIAAGRTAVLKQAVRPKRF
jgi:hypothetical protein